MVLAAIKGLILSWICLLHRVSKSGCWEEVVVVGVGGSFSPHSPWWICLSLLELGHWSLVLAEAVWLFTLFVLSAFQVRLCW